VVREKMNKCKCGEEATCEVFKLPGEVETRKEPLNLCSDCFNKIRTKAECYSRVVGYFRPVDDWNDAKQSEFKDRKNFVVDK
jgi:anaerobic ribonucleoside-triphosphate reductase